MENVAADQILSLGDTLRTGSASTGHPVRRVAAFLGFSAELGVKAAWLAGRYSPNERAEIGTEALSTLTRTHLETAARVREPKRTALLRRAAAEQISARKLKAMVLAMPSRSEPRISGAAGDLISSARAVEHYINFDDVGLKKLLSGPNGAAIRSLARAGRALAARIEKAAL
jgi:hypothetical protein